MTARWELRFENYERVLGELEDAFALRTARPLSDLEMSGAIKRFEMCFELGWKVLRDYLADGGAPLDIPSPVNSIRGGLAMNLIADGDGWIATMKLRNSLAHEYSFEQATAAIEQISSRVIPLFRALRTRLADERA